MIRLSFYVVIAIWCLGFAALVVRLAKQKKLTTRYALGWLAIDAAFGAWALGASLAKPISIWLHTEPVYVIIVSMGAAIVAIVLLATISISKLSITIRMLVEYSARLEERIRVLESDKQKGNSE